MATRINPKKIVLSKLATVKDKDGNGINLSDWISSQIDQGFISISGGDTHMMNTSLTSSSNLSHNIGNANTWRLGHTTASRGELKFNGSTSKIGLVASAGIVYLGDEIEAGNKTFITVDDDGVEIQLASVGTITLGDVLGDNNNTTLEIDDDAQDIVLAANSVSNEVSNFYVTSDAGEITIECSEGAVSLGSIGSGNGTQIIIDDDNQLISMYGATTTMNADGGIITLVSSEGTIRLGDPDGGGNNTYLTIDDSNQEITLNAGSVIQVGSSLQVDELNSAVTFDEDQNGILTVFGGAEDNPGNGFTLVVDTIYGQVIAGTYTDKGLNLQHIDEAAIGDAFGPAAGCLGYRAVLVNHTLDLAATSAATLNIPTGAILMGVQFNVDTAVTTSGSNNTWSAAFTGGSTTTAAAVASPGASNSKINTPLIEELTTDVTNMLFTAGNGENFATGGIRIVVYYRVLESLADSNL